MRRDNVVIKLKNRNRAVASEEKTGFFFYTKKRNNFYTILWQRYTRSSIEVFGPESYIMAENLIRHFKS